MFFNFLPILFLALAAIIVIILERFRPSMGASWITAVVGSVLALTSILIFRWNSPQPMVIEDWLHFEDISFNLAFGYDPIAWQFIFCIAVVLLALLLTVPIRLTVSNEPKAWVLDIILVAGTMLSVLSQTPITLILTWTMIDIFEVIILVIYSSETSISRQAVISLAARITGTWMLLWVMFFSQFKGDTQINFSNIPAEYGLLILLAVILRLGIFPIFIPFAKEIPVRRELGTVLRFIVPVSSLTLLSRLSGLVIPSQWAIVISIVALVAALFGSIMFLLSSSELTGRSYFVITLVGMATMCVVRGRAEAGLTWALALVLIGSLLSLHSYRKKFALWIMIVGFLGLTGLPFSPAANGWTGLIVFPFNGLDILTMVVHAILLMGFLKHAFRVEESEDVAERWMIVLYPIGLIILIAAQWFLQMDMFLGSINNQVWWFSIITTGLALLLPVAFIRIQSLLGFNINQTLLDGTTDKIAQGAVYKVIDRLFQDLQGVIGMINRILEGEGAVLWAILLFLMLMTVIGIGAGGSL